MNHLISLVSDWINHGFVSLAIDSAIKSLVLLSLVWAATRLLRNRPAALRHLLWTAGLASILIIPSLALSLPSWRALPASMNPDGRFAPLLVPNSHLQNDSEPSQQIAAYVQTKFAAPSPAMVLFIAWAIGAAACLQPTLIAQIRLWRFSRRCHVERDTDLTDELAAIARELCLRRSADLLITDESFMPMTFGILRPKLVLPRDAQDWPAIRIRAVMLHELAHVKRLDCLTHLIAQIVRAIYWFNPLSWVAVRQMQAERERACDDRVTGAGIRRVDYARQILEICSACRCESPTSAAMPIAGASPVERRIRDILNHSQPRGTLTMKQIFIAFIMMALLVVPMSILQAADAPAASPTTQPDAGDKDRYQRRQAASSLRDVLYYCVVYANDHHGDFPPDLGALAPLLAKPGLPDEQPATMFVDPRNPVDVPKELSADWINKNSPWTYFGGGANIQKILNTQEVVVIHSDLDNPFDGVILAGFADGHVEGINVGRAQAMIAQSKEAIQKSGSAN
jgi:beta-lactamase regulating signal transducer with metallopeptidase domain